MLIVFYFFEHRIYFHLLVYMVQLIFVVVLSFSGDELKIEIDCRLAAILDLSWPFKTGQQISPGHEGVATNRYGHRQYINGAGAKLYYVLLNRDPGIEIWYP